VSESAASRLPSDITPPEGSLSPEKVAGIVQNFRRVFEEMSVQLEFAQVIDENSEMKELGESDIRGFLRDVIKFSHYIRTWETKKIDVSRSIKSLNGIRDYLQKVGVQLNTALSDAAKLSPANTDTVQFDKGKEAYLARLTNCSNLLSAMLRDCFVAKN
jgi:hypothetical protein